jgi:hypothetical protein
MLQIVAVLRRGSLLQLTLIMQGSGCYMRVGDTLEWGGCYK